MSHPMPVSRKIHQGPASRASPARALDRMSVRSSMALMSSFLSGQLATVYGSVCRMIYPVSETMTPGQEQIST
jgi:hypothetical protein